MGAGDDRDRGGGGGGGGVEKNEWAAKADIPQAFFPKLLSSPASVSCVSGDRVFSPSPSPSLSAAPCCTCREAPDQYRATPQPKQASVGVPASLPRPSAVLYDHYTAAKR